MPSRDVGRVTQESNLSQASLLTLALQHLHCSISFYVLFTFLVHGSQWADGDTKYMTLPCPTLTSGLLLLTVALVWVRWRKLLLVLKLLQVTLTHH